MDFEQLFANFHYNDLQWFIPVLAGLVIIIGGLLVALLRGMTSGVIVALFFGGLMSLSPVLLEALQRTSNPASLASIDVARGAAELTMMNNEAITDLSRVVATLRTAMETIRPVVSPPGVTPDNPSMVQRFNQSITDTEEQLDSTISTLSRASLLRQRLQENINALDAEQRRLAR